MINNYGQAERASKLKLKTATVDALKTSYETTDDVLFSIVATGLDLKYSWEVQLPGSTEWSPIAGAVTSQLRIESVKTTDNGTKFRCRVSNAKGEVISNPATLTVNQITTPPVITTQPSNKTIDPTNFVNDDTRCASYVVVVNNA